MSPPDAHSSLAALRQLKEMLDAGTITPQEFETLKRQLIFGTEPALPLAAPAEPFAAPAAPVSAPEPAAPVLPEALAPAPEETIAAYQTAAPGLLDYPPPPPAGPDWLALAAPNLLSKPEPAAPMLPADERRNPLNLVFIIGGALVLLGIVCYLLIGRPAAPDEHLTSASQTAADSTTVAPEVGPQAEQITLPPATAPETVRVAPVVRPVTIPAAGQFRADSTALPAKAPAKASAATPAAAPMTTVTDSTSSTKAP